MEFSLEMNPCLQRVKHCGDKTLPGLGEEHCHCFWEYEQATN